MSEMQAPRYLDPVETMPRPALQALQERRLLAMLPYAYQHAPLIRQLWDAAGVKPSDIRDVQDYLARAPFMDKDMVRDYREQHGDPYGGLLCIARSEVSFMGSSSGTTGDPTLFSYRWGQPDGMAPQAPGLAGDSPPTLFGSTLRDLWEMGLREGDKIIYFGLRMRGPIYRVFQNAGYVPVFLTYSNDDPLQFIDLSRRLRPAAFFVMTSFLAQMLLKIEREMGIDMRDVFSSYKAIIFAGEPIGPGVRATFERWGVGHLLFNETSLGDIGHAHDCREHDGCHAWEDIALVEALDPETGASLAGDCRGELAVTSLVNDVDPLIRYRTGDIVDMKRGTCACGRTHARFMIVGRLSDEIMIGGRSILPTDVWPAIEQVAETGAGIFQLIRPRRVLETLTIRVGYDGTPDLADLARRVADQVQARIGIRPDIELVPHDVILQSGSRHKFPRTAKK
jgi:phenylacetate-CoA ligase